MYCTYVATVPSHNMRVISFDRGTGLYSSFFLPAVIQASVPANGGSVCGRANDLIFAVLFFISTISGVSITVQ